MTSSSTLPYFSFSLNGPIGGVVTSVGDPVHLTGFASVVVGSAGSVSGGDGLSTVDLGNGLNTISLGGAFNTVVLGNGVNTVYAGGATGSVGFGAHTLTASYGNAFSATLAAADWPQPTQAELAGATNPPQWNIGAFNAGSGNIGAFNGLANASASSGNGNIGVFNGDVNGGASNGNNNIGALNGNLNGLGSSPGSGDHNGSGNVGLLNGNDNGNLAVGGSSGSGNGADNIGFGNGNSNGNGLGPTFTPSSAHATLTGGFDTVVVGNGVNHIDAAAGASTIVAGKGVNVITIGGDDNTVVTGGGVSWISGSAVKDSVIAAGGWKNAIDLGHGSTNDTIVLHTTGYDVISGFSISGGDRLDLGYLMTGTSWNGDPSTLGQWLSVTHVGGATILDFTAAGQDPPVAELVGLDVSLSALTPTFVIDGAAVVPEPSVVLLLGLGFAAALLAGRRFAESGRLAMAGSPAA
ncbi:putative secreted protein with PEP-CTERM sorting signal/predicted secreted protein (type I secretion substrate) [Roseiarcus fermentans]|uniref:Putative secreted protein with PEP-CTERM sorting signal/predicted secreted protein (Type I secretion substrate) n=1 Tax=Roseiarcus fermentans TaxID=1473586 RepID=A0A366F3R7_9HYPH|nr:type I secretion C-terminal target domain-containing protein [Roseiarcus fermentans]RBP09247.1 putative secreted protein with PEP-CTERM sorting signal/predicted secreted protein (type I secretion substrate) [Roseiarcus fermentans]